MHSLNIFMNKQLSQKKTFLLLETPPCTFSCRGKETPSSNKDTPATRAQRTSETKTERRTMKLSRKVKNKRKIEGRGKRSSDYRRGLRTRVTDHNGLLACTDSSSTDPVSWEKTRYTSATKSEQKDLSCTWWCVGGCSENT